MTTHELMCLALAQASLDEEDMEALHGQLLTYLNEGYMTLMNRKYRPWMEELVTARDGEIALEACARRPERILAATQGGRALRTILDEGAGTIKLLGVEDGAIVLRYRYLPRPLAEASDAPRLPAWSHGALADWASYRLLNNGSPSRQQRGQSFRMAFEETLRLLEPFGKPLAQRKHFAGLY